MRISDWNADVCSSDLIFNTELTILSRRPACLAATPVASAAAFRLGSNEGSDSMRILMALPLLLLGAAPVFSQPIVATAPAGEIKVVKVGYADLNLDSESGLARPDRRLRPPARSVCGVRPEVETTLREINRKNR